MNVAEEGHLDTREERALPSSCKGIGHCRERSFFMIKVEFSGLF